MKGSYGILQGFKDVIFLAVSGIRVWLTNDMPYRAENIDYHGITYEDYRCPKCGERVSYLYYENETPTLRKFTLGKHPYCSNCGKKINWKLIDKICKVANRYGVDVWEIESEEEIENAVFKNFK